MTYYSPRGVIKMFLDHIIILYVTTIKQYKYNYQNSTVNKKYFTKIFEIFCDISAKSRNRIHIFMHANESGL